MKTLIKKLLSESLFRTLKPNLHYDIINTILANGNYNRKALEDLPIFELLRIYSSLKNYKLKNALKPKEYEQIMSTILSKSTEYSFTELENKSVTDLFKIYNNLKDK